MLKSFSTGRDCGVCWSSRVQLTGNWLCKWAFKCDAITQLTSQGGKQEKYAWELEAEIDDAQSFTLGHSARGVEEWHTPMADIERAR